MRTDQTQLCTGCALRFSPKRPCPKCGSGGENLLAPSARRDALSKLHRRRLFWAVPRPSAGCYVAIIVSGIIVLTFAVGIGALFIPGGAWLAIIAYVTVPTVCTILWVFFLPEASDFANPKHRSRWDRPMAIRLHDARRDEGDRTVSGTVVSDSPLRSPLGGVPCAAFRLRGKAGRVDIDDSSLSAFELRGDDDTVAAVDEHSAVVDIGLPRPESVQPSEQLMAFLERLGVEPGAELQLGETVLCDGDVAVVSGRASESERGDGEGYRGTETVWTFVDEPDQPLVIRTASH